MLVVSIRLLVYDDTIPVSYCQLHMNMLHKFQTLPANLFTTYLPLWVTLTTN